MKRPLLLRSETWWKPTDELTTREWKAITRLYLALWGFWMAAALLLFDMVNQMIRCRGLTWWYLLFG